MHPLLQRQLARYMPTGTDCRELELLIQAVDDAYRSSDEDRALLERSEELTSRELTERNAELVKASRLSEQAHAELQDAHQSLQQLNEQLEARVAQRTAELRSANDRLLADIAHRQEMEDALRQAEQKYRTMFENATHGIFQTTLEGRHLGCNPSLARIYGYDSPEDLVSTLTDVGRQLYVDDKSRPLFVQQLREHGRVTKFETRFYRKDRSIIWVSINAREVKDLNGGLLYYEGFVSDITARKVAEEALRESEERFELAVRGASVGLWDWNLRTAQVYFSPRWKEMLGCAETEIGARPEEWFNRVHTEDLESLRAAITAHREGLTPHFEIEHRMLHKDGRYRWMLSCGIAIRDESGCATRMAGSQTDICQRKELEQQLLRDALHDGLTGLPNRALFTDRLQWAIARAKRDAEHLFAVLFIDLDRFKGINDSLGHAMGDELLTSFAQRLNSCLRPSDTVARLGGDEFTVLLEDSLGTDDAGAIADRILATLQQPFILGAQEVFITCSIGIAVSNSSYTRPQDMVRDADIAMYRAKSLGKSRYQLFDTAMHTRAVNLLQIENDLRRAIDRDEFELYYQPIQNIETGKMSGFEALIRWRHPERGLIAPAEFIPISEDTGLIVPIGRWVLREACRQTAAWHSMFPDNLININVNLSGKQFAQTDLVEQVINALKHANLPPQYLVLEITESVVMVNPASASAMLRRLKDLGVKLNIDDFGTGYSSLACLQQFPVDTMKIDKSFISRMSESSEGLEIVRTIIELAHNMSMKVTAEGIETAAQLNQLESLNCEQGQGYLLSRPLEQTAATNLLTQFQAKSAAA